MKRRDFITGATGLAAGAIGGVAATRVATSTADRSVSGAPAVIRGLYEWRMVTTWPDKFPGLGTGAEWLAKRLSDMSDGRLSVTVYSQEQLGRAFGAFDAVARGEAEMGHCAAYYWQRHSRACALFSAVPFGLTATELSAWIHEGGGQQLYDELYAGFGLKPFLAGNTGAQMGGWFVRPLTTAADLRGIKMRVPGLGGEIYRRVGATAMNLPGSDILDALRGGTIDAAEWVGPWNDLTFGFHDVTKHYYWPGFQEPGTGVEVIVNKASYDALPADLKAVIANACQAETDAMLAEFTTQNATALKTLVDQHGVQLHRFPDDVLTAFGTAAQDVLADYEAGDAVTRRIYASFKSFRDGVLPWSKIADQGYMTVRAKALGLD